MISTVKKIVIGGLLAFLCLSAPLMGAFTWEVQSGSSTSPTLFVTGTLESLAGSLTATDVPTLYELFDSSGQSIWHEQLPVQYVDSAFGVTIGQSGSTPLTAEIIAQAREMTITLIGIQDSSGSDILASVQVLYVPKAIVASQALAVSWNNVTDQPQISELSGSINVTQLPIIPFSKLDITSTNIKSLGFTVSASVTTDDILAINAANGVLTSAVSTLNNNNIASDANIDPSKILNLVASLNSKIDAALLSSTLSGTNAIFTGTVTANVFQGDGSQLTGIGSGSIGSDSVSSTHLQNNAVTTDKISDDAVTSAKILDGTVSLNDLNTDAVDASKIVDGSISNADLATNAVASDNIEDGAITTSKLAANSVSSTHIIDQTITADDLALQLISNELVATGSFSNITGVGSLTGTLQGQNGDFSGTFQAARFSGDGANLTGVVGLGTLTNQLVGTTATFSGTVSANTFQGDGSQLTGVVATSIGSLSSQLVGTTATFSGTVSANAFQGDGSGLTGVVGLGTLTNQLIGSTATFSGTVSANAFQGDGSGLTGIVNLGTLTSQLIGTTATFSGTVSANVFRGDGSQLTGVVATGIGALTEQLVGTTATFSGTVSANAFQGNGSGLIGITNIANNAVANDQMADNAIGNAEMADNAIGNAEMQDDAITNAELATGSFPKITGIGSLTSQLIGTTATFSGTVSASVFQGDGSQLTGVVATGIADNAITNAKMADNAIGNAEMQDDAITNAELATGSFPKITGLGSLTSQLIGTTATFSGTVSASVFQGDGSQLAGVVAADIADNTITNAKMADNAIGNAEMQDDAITNTELATGSFPKITGLGSLTSQLIGTTATFSGTVSASVFQGDGSQLTGVVATGIADNAITNAKMADNAIGNAEMADNAIGNTEMADNAIGNAEMQDDAITNAELATGSFPKITGLGSLTSQLIGTTATFSGTVSASVFQGDGSQLTGVVATGIADNAITNAKMADNAIGNAEMADNAIGNAEMADNAIGNAEMQDNAITNAELATGSFPKITGLGSLTSQLIGTTATFSGTVSASVFQGDGSQLTGVVATGIADNAITNAKMADNAIGNAEMADNAIGNAEMQDDAITNAEIATGSFPKITGLGSLTSQLIGTTATFSGTVSASVFQGDGSQLSGVVATDIADNAITNAKMADNAVGNAEMADNAIGNAEMADNAIGNAEMADNAIGNAEMQDNAISNAELATGSFPKITGLGSLTSQLIGTTATFSGTVSASVFQGDGSQLTGVVATGIADNAITNAKMADNAIGNAEMADNAIGNAEMQDDAITNAEIATGSFPKITGLGSLTSQLIGTTATFSGTVSASVFQGDGSQLAGVVAADIADNAITNAKMADNAIGNAEMADNAISNAELATGSFPKITGLGTLTTQLIGDTATFSGTVSASVFQGDGSQLVGVVATGIADNAITNAKMADNAIGNAEMADNAIGNAEMQDDAITNAEIATGSFPKITGLGSLTSQLIGTTATFSGTVSASVFQGDGSQLAGVVATDIADNAITNAKMADNAIGNAEMADNAISNAEMADNAIGNAEMADNAIGNAEMQDNAISNAELATGSFPKITGLGSLTSQLIGTTATFSGTVSASVFQGDGSQLVGVVATGIADNAITNAKMADNAIGNAEMADNAIGNAEMLDNAIGNAEMADNAIGNAEMADNAISNAELATGSFPKITGLGTLTTQLIGDTATFSGTVSASVFQGDGSQLSGVVATDIADNAITNAKMADNAIGNAEMADNAIGNAEMQDNAISNAELATGSFPKITGLGSLTTQLIGTTATFSGTVSASVFQGDGSQLSGVVATGIADNAITNAKMADNAIGNAEMADNAIGNAEMLDNAIGNAEMADNAIGNAEMADNAISNAELATGSFPKITGLGTLTTQLIGTTATFSGTVSASVFQGDGSQLSGVVATDIADNAITNAKMADNAIGNAEMADNAISNAELATGSFPKITGLGSLTSQLIGTTATFSGTVSASVFQGDGSQLSGVVATGIADNAITNAKMADNAIGNAEMADNAIGNAEMLDNAIGNAEMADNAIGNAEMADNAIGNAEMLDDAIGNAEMADNAIGNAEMRDNAIGNAEMADNAITNAEIATGSFPKITGLGSLTSQLIGTTATFSGTVSASVFQGDGSQLSGVVAADIADNAVTNAKMADNAVGNAEMADNAIGNAEMQDNAIGNAEMADNAIGNAEMADNAIGNAEMLDNAIGNAEMADNAIGNAEMQDNAISNAELATGSFPKITGLGTLTTQLIGDTATFSGTVSASVFQGDGSQLAGVVATDIADNAITNAKMADNAVGNAEMADNAIGNAEMQDNAIGNAEMADNAVGNAEMLDDAIGNAEMADNAIGNAEMRDNAIGNAEMADNAITNAEIATGSFPKITGLGTLTTQLIGDTATFSGTVSASVFQGDGSQLAGVVATDIADNAITNAKMADNAIGNAEMADNAISNAELATGSFPKITGLGTLTTQLIGDTATFSGTVSASVFQGDGSQLAGVVAVDVADNAITNAKMADNAIGNAEMADNAITNAEIATGSFPKITGLGTLTTQLIGDTATFSGTVSADALVLDNQLRFTSQNMDIMINGNESMLSAFFSSAFGHSYLALNSFHPTSISDYISSTLTTFNIAITKNALISHTLHILGDGEKTSDVNLGARLVFGQRRDTTSFVPGVGFVTVEAHDVSFQEKSFGVLTGHATNGFVFENFSDTITDQVMQIRHGATTSNGIEYIEFLTADSNTPAGTISYTSTGGGGIDYALLDAELNNDYIAKGSLQFESSGADYAEYIEKQDISEDMKPGHIVGVYNGKITKATTGAHRVMVISSEPIVLGNSSPGMEDIAETVAFVGQVPVQVYGVVNAGDYIIPSGKEDGTGIAVAPAALKAEHLSQIVGQAWQSSTKTGLKYIKVAITPLDNPSDVIRNIQANQDKLEAKMNRMEKELDALKAALKSK